MFCKVPGHLLEFIVEELQNLYSMYFSYVTQVRSHITLTILNENTADATIDQ